MPRRSGAEVENMPHTPMKQPSTNFSVQMYNLSIDYFVDIALKLNLKFKYKKCEIVNIWFFEFLQFVEILQ